MEKFKITYLDESGEDIRAFQRFASSHFDVIPLKPIPSLDEMLTTVFENGAAALVVDYDLSEEAPTIHYSGTDIVEGILAQRPDFPVFILTSYDEQALENGDDVNIVYEKKEMYDKNVKFLQKINTQIVNYNRRLDQKEDRILELNKLREQRDLTLDEENELIELDSYIEEALNKKDALPNALKTISNEMKLVSLLSKVDILLKKVDNSDEQSLQV
jgi:vacuolar-type H+-ATPase subunit I/STV1